MQKDITTFSHLKTYFLWLGIFLLFLASCQMMALVSPDLSNLVGAKLGVDFLVVDDDTEEPIVGAQVKMTDCGCFWGKKNKTFATGSNGVAKVRMSHVFPYGKIDIGHEGYYPFHTQFDGYVHTIPDHDRTREHQVRMYKEVFSLGKWRPFGEMHTIRLRRIVRPVPMISRTITANKLSGKEFGVDFQEGALCAPYGWGKQADLLVRIDSEEFEQEHPDWPGRQVKVRKTTCVLRSAGEHDGLSRLDGLVGSQLLSTREVPQDTSFQHELVFRHELSELGETVGGLEDDQWILVRSRTEVDDQGEIVRANYAKIYPDFFTVCNGGIEFRYYFNPEPNDIGLEFAPELNLKIDERSAYFKLR